jgi:hypothetical protein
MFIFGHLGIGWKLSSPLARNLPVRAVLAGTLLPDLIDKPLFYGERAIQALANPGFEIPLVTCTRTFGHTAGLTFALTSAAWALRSRTCAALALGALSHQALDVMMDLFLKAEQPSALIALVWPLFGPMPGRFADTPFTDLEGHLSTLGNMTVIGAELLGAALLLELYFKARRGSTKIT